MNPLDVKYKTAEEIYIETLIENERLKCELELERRLNERNNKKA